jgi:pSer/pThr/pTyr-binding forkhead associated (FHA) protein
VLDDRATSRRAAEFVLEDGGLWVVDSGCKRGISVAGEVVERRRLRPGDEVEIGAFTIELCRGAGASTAGEPTVIVGSKVAFEDDRTVVLSEVQPKPELVLPDGSHIELEDGTLVLGRSGECDILLASSAASKRHAELRVQGGVVTLVDLGSTNGSRVNGERVEERVLVSGDSLELADVSYQIVVPVSAPVRQQSAEAARDDAADAASADLQEQVRAEAAAMARDEVKVRVPPEKRRLSPIVVAAAAAIVVGLVAISVLVSRQQTAAVEPANGPGSTSSSSELFRQGLELYEIGEVLDALDLWEQAIVLDAANSDLVDRYAQTLYRLGLIYEGDGQVDQAVGAWRRLTSQVQRTEHPYVVRAAAKLRKYE